MIFAIREQSTLHAVCAFAAVLTVAIMFFSFDQSRLVPLPPSTHEPTIDISKLPVFYPTGLDCDTCWTTYSGMNGAVNGMILEPKNFQPTSHKDVWRDDVGNCYYLYPATWKFEDGSSWKATPRGLIRIK